MSAGASLAFLAACSSDSSKPKATASGTAGDKAALDKLPGVQRLREGVKHLEPTNYVKTYKVDATGKGGAFTTLQACYAAVMADKQKALGVAGLVGAQSNPWDWRKIEVAPGVYKETASGTPPHTAVVGLGNTPTDVRVVFDGNDDAVATTGRSAYFANMSFEHTSNNPDLHAMRDEGQSGDVGLGPLQRRTIIFESCHFTAAAGAPWGKTAADILSGPGTTIAFANCVFEAPGQAQTISLVTNAKAASGKSQYFLIGCTVAGNEKSSTSGDANPKTSFPVGVPDFSEKRGDDFVWMDGHWQVGKAVPVGALLAFPAVVDAGTSMKQINPSTRYIVVNPGSQAGVKVTAPDKVLPVQSDVPDGLSLPFGGTSDQEAAFFGSRPSKSEQSLEPKAAQAGTVSVKAGETYWVAFDLDGHAACASGVKVGDASNGVKAVALTLDKDGKPEENGNAITTGKGIGGGKVATQARWYYPGQGPVWVGVTFGADVEVPAMKAVASGAYRASGSGDTPTPTGLTVIAEGTLVPRPTILSAWTTS